MYGGKTILGDNILPSNYPAVIFQDSHSNSEMSTIWIDVHYYPEREGGNSEIEPLVVKTDLNMKFLIIFRFFFTLFLIFIFNWGEGRKNKIKT